MARVDGFFRKLGMLFRRDRFRSELDEEMAFHRAQAEREFVAGGISPEVARLAVARQFGNPALLKERSHEAIRFRFETVVQDVRYGVRMLLCNPGFTVVAVVALALGIGINTAAFTAYKAFFGRSLDARNPEQMVNLALTLKTGATSPWFSYPDYEEYRNHIHSFSGGIAASFPQNLTFSSAAGVVSQRSSTAGTLVGRLGLLGATSNKEFAATVMVSDNYFSVLGATPIRGRDFSKVPEITNSPSALISEYYWQKRFAGDPEILGKTVRLNGVTFTIIGITPHNFVGAGVQVPDFWIPFSAEPLIHPDDNRLRNRENLCCRLFARLAPGASDSQAEAEMTSLAEHVRTLHASNSDLSKTASALVWPGSPFPLPINRYNEVRYAVMLIMLAVGMVLVVACANVASLQLARAAARRNELAMRTSLGASRLRLIRQLLTESALLGLLAGVVALLMSWAMLEILVDLIADAFPAEYGTFIFHVAPDMGVFAYVFAISIGAGALFGLVPALESSKSALSSGFKANSGTSPKSNRRLRNLLTGAQVSFSAVLMIAGGMLIHSSIRALKMDTGYETKQVVDLNFRFPEGSKYTPAVRLALIHELRNRLTALPGTTSVTSAWAPDENGARHIAVFADGTQQMSQKKRANLYYTYVEPRYFETLGIPIRFGKNFQRQTGVPEPVVVLSESAAKVLWPEQNPVGRSIRMNTQGQFHPADEIPPDGPRYQVIGVARDTRGVMMDGSDSAQIYLQTPDANLADYPLLIRTKADTTQLIRDVEPVIASVDPDLMVTSTTLDALLHETESFIISSLCAAIASTVGFLGLILTSMGIYGTVSYIVVLRTREVGIRIALGATKRDILGLMMRESTRPVITGLAVGMMLAIGVSYLLRGVMYGLHTVDGISFIGVSLLFVAIALLAAYVPSRRALRVDPVDALRAE